MKFPEVNKEFIVKFNEVIEIDSFPLSAKVEQTEEGANITITDKTGTTTATIKHGADGNTPQKGTDYFTEADKAELVEEVLESIPGGGNVGTDFGGVEITDGEPTKESTVMTLNPNAEEVHLYTAEEIDAKFDALVNGNEVAY